MDIPSSLMAPAQGMANLAQSLTNLSSTFIEIDERRRQKEAAASRLAEVSKFDLYSVSSLDPVFEEYKQAGHDEETIEKYRAAMEGKFNESRDFINTVDDPILKSALTQRFVHHSMSYGKSFNDVTTRKKGIAASSAAFELANYAAKEYMAATDPDSEATAMELWSNSVGRAEVSGAWSVELANKQRNLMESTISRKTEVKIESGIANGDTLSIDARKQFLRDIADPTKFPAVTDPMKRRTYYNQAVTAFTKLNREEIEQSAYEKATRIWPDPEQAKVEVLRPEFMKQFGLDMNQAQNLAQSFSMISSQKKVADKDRQEKNLDSIRAVAVTDPAKALKMLRTVEDVDPKDSLALQRATESHIRQMSLMSAQEKSLRMDIEDKEKAGIKSDILAGRFKTEQELVNAVIAKGFTNTSGFIDDALGNFRNFKKDAGAVNFFKSAEEDWDKLIQTTKSKEGKRKLQDMKPKMLEGLRVQMEKEGLRSFDPKVFELYQTNRKALTATWITEALDAVKAKIGIGGDTFVAPSAPPKEVPGGGWQMKFPAPALDEATARKRLKDMKITGKAQDDHIKRYRDEGLLK